MCGRLEGIVPTTVWPWGDRPHGVGARAYRWWNAVPPLYCYFSRQNTNRNKISTAYRPRTFLTIGVKLIIRFNKADNIFAAFVLMTQM